MQYNQPYGGAADAPYVNGNPSTGLAGSIPPAASIEYPQREIVNLITDTGTTATNSDLHQLAKAVQSGLLNYHLDSGTANNYAVLLAPVPNAYVAGLFCVAKIANDNTGASVLNISSLGNKNIVHRDGSTLTAGELKSGGLYAFHYDGTNFQLVWSTAVAGAQVFLTAARTFYVNSSIGNDSLDGTTSTLTGGHGPFLTMQRAANEVIKYNLNGFDITVNVAAGTYAAFSAGTVPGSGLVHWVGDTATPANCNIVANAAAGGANLQGETHFVKGFKISNSGGGGIVVSGKAFIYNIEWGACVGPMIQVSYGATLRMDGTAYKISGSATTGANPGCFLYAYQGATVEMTNIGSLPSLTLTGTPSFAAAFIVAKFLSSSYVVFSSITGSGTGTRYAGDTLSSIYTGGLGASYYPGNVAGAVINGSIYV